MTKHRQKGNITGGKFHLTERNTLIMAEKLATYLISLLDGLLAFPYGKQAIVFIISLLPILELRGGLIAASLLGLKPLESYIIAIIANIIPVPFILWLIKTVLYSLKNSKYKFCQNIGNWLYKKVDKHRGTIDKYGFLGLILFVGIPLPGTGAWTGSLIAGVLDMDRRKAFGTILLGLVMASVIMMIVSFGLISAVI